MLLLEAQGHIEGAFTLGSRAQRNHNPTNMIAGEEANRFGATGSDGEFAIFPDWPTGWKAAQKWWSVPAKLQRGPVKGFPFTDPNGTTLGGGYLGATLAQCIYRFAPPSSNNTEAYIAFLIANVPGLLRTTVITADLLQIPLVAPE